ncbi:MAG: hypothetical protein IJM37_04170 [Lachnospiraceae bacterium]|nr:hypothetical protein [Lachnospiraceae bacterium]
MKNLKKKILCTVLSLTLLIGSSIPSMAASGTVYSYANLRLTWTTSSTKTGATIKSGTNAYLTVSIDGYFYTSWGTVERREASGSNYGLQASCSVPLKTANNGVTHAYGVRSNNQSVVATLYY